MKNPTYNQNKKICTAMGKLELSKLLGRKERKK